MLAKPENLTDSFQKLTSIKEIRGSVIISRNGMVILSNLPKDIDVGLFCAMAATTYESMENINNKLNSPRTQVITADQKEQRIIIIPCGSKAILSLITTNKFDPRKIDGICEEIASSIAQYI